MTSTRIADSAAPANEYRRVPVRRCPRYETARERAAERDVRAEKV